MLSDQLDLVRAREDFFDHGRVTPGVRDSIVLSWRRSAQLGLSPDSRPTPQFGKLAERPGVLFQAAEPVVLQLLRDIGTDCAAMLVMDRDGVVVGRWSEPGQIRDVMDKSHIHPGRVLDEACAGTTALGTPLEDRRPAIVAGAEHALASFDPLTAVGTPILHPTRGTVDGVIDIVGRVGVDTTMMLPLVTRAAKEIGERLITGYSSEDRDLMDAFLIADRRGTRRPILAINKRLIIGNVLANSLGLSARHSQLWADILTAANLDRNRISVGLVNGRPCMGHVSLVGAEPAAGALLHVEYSNRANLDANSDSSVTSLTTPASARPERNPLDAAERRTIIDALNSTGGNRRATAERLGISRASLYRKIDRLNI